jgi:PBSX family phage portal protein
MAPSRKRGRAISARIVRTPFSGEREETDPQIIELKKFQSQQILDPFDGVYGSQTAGLTTMAPTYSPLALMRLPNENSILRQCIDAYVINIESYGSRLEYIGADEEQESVEAKAEHARLTGLLNQPNEEYSLIELRQRVRRDIETFGCGYIEVGRDKDSNIAMMYHALAHTIRITHRERDATPVKVWMERDGKLRQLILKRRFRRYVQIMNGERVFFKEFGDPRPIDPATGEVNANLSLEDQATELYHIPLYSSGEVYGLPRWINQLPNILGTRESELTNLQFFRDNAIPAMAVLVSGGMLTEAAIENIENHITSSKGREGMNRLLVIEASGDEEAASDKGQIPAPRVDLKPLSDARQKDGTFQEYETNAQTKIRSSFRLPPLFLGRTEDMTYATASASLSVAEAQVFGPERNKIDEIFNGQFLTIDGKPPQYWRLRSNPPRISNPEDVVAAIENMNAVGAMTPNIAIGLANEMFDLAIPMIEEPWGNYPFSFSTALLGQDQLQGLEELRRVLGTEPDENNGEATKVRRRVRPRRMVSV